MSDADDILDDLRGLEEKILTAAVAEYLYQHELQSADEDIGRRAAVRGMMVRLGLYNQFNDALAADGGANG